MKKLLERPGQFAPRGVVRSDKSAAQLKGYGATDAQLVVADILREGGEAALQKVGWAGLGACSALGRGVQRSRRGRVLSPCAGRPGAAWL